MSTGWDPHYRQSPAVAFNDSPNATALLQWNTQSGGVAPAASSGGRRKNLHRGTDVQGRTAKGWLSSARQPPAPRLDGTERRVPAVAFNDSPNASALLQWEVREPTNPAQTALSQRGTDTRGRGASGWLPSDQPKDNLVHLQWKQQQQQRSLAAQREAIQHGQRPNQRPTVAAAAFNDSPNTSVLLKWDTTESSQAGNARVEHLTHRGTDVRGRKACGWLPAKVDQQNAAGAFNAGARSAPASAFNDSPNAAALLKWDTRGPTQTSDPALLTHRGTDVRSRKACGWIEDSAGALPPVPAEEQTLHLEPAATSVAAAGGWGAAPGADTFAPPSAGSQRAAMPPPSQQWQRPPSQQPSQQQPQLEAQQQPLRWGEPPATAAGPSSSSSAPQQRWADPPLEPRADGGVVLQPYLVEAAGGNPHSHAVPSAPSRYYATTGFNSQGAKDRVTSAMPDEESLRAHQALTSGFEPIQAECVEAVSYLIIY